MIVREPTVGYFTFLKLYFWSWYQYVKILWDDGYKFPHDFYKDIEESCHLNPLDLAIILFVAVGLTFLRIFLSKHYFLPLCIALRSPKNMLGKLPENIWKLSFYTVSWSWCFYVVFWRHRHWITDPLSLWEEWSVDLVITWDIYVLYMVQFGFYIHSVYATIYLDPHRKDFALMLIHHAITLTLIGWSYCANHHMQGAMVLLCHDINDVFLESWKLNSNWRQRADGKYFALHDRLAVVSFVLFMSSWFYTRLYLYPLKVMYAAIYGPVVMNGDYLIRFWPLFASLLTLLLALNVYWSKFFVVGLYKYLAGGLEVVEDVREFDTDPEKNGVETNTNHKID